MQGAAGPRPACPPAPGSRVTAHPACTLRCPRRGCCWNLAFTSQPQCNHQVALLRGQLQAAAEHAQAEHEARVRDDQSVWAGLSALNLLHTVAGLPVPSHLTGQERVATLLDVAAGAHSARNHAGCGVSGESTACTARGTVLCRPAVAGPHAPLKVLEQVLHEAADVLGPAQVRKGSGKWRLMKWVDMLWCMPCPPPTSLPPPCLLVQPATAPDPEVSVMLCIVVDDSISRECEMRQQQQHAAAVTVQARV